MVMHHRTLRSLVTLVVALSILLAVPISAGARGPESPQTTLGAAEGWMNAALGWLQDALEIHRPAGHHHVPAGIRQKDASGNSASGGSCIDPVGNRYPPPCIWF
jgi:hypothetical protein